VVATKNKKCANGAASVGGLFHFKSKTTSTRLQHRNWRSQALTTNRWFDNWQGLRSGVCGGQAGACGGLAWSGKITEVNHGNNDRQSDDARKHYADDGCHKAIMGLYGRPR
jgi:hypothetical protein